MNLSDLPPDARREVLRRVKRLARTAAPGARATNRSFGPTGDRTVSGDRQSTTNTGDRKFRSVTGDKGTAGWRCHDCGEEFTGHGAIVGYERHRDEYGHYRYDWLLQ